MSDSQEDLDRAQAIVDSLRRHLQQVTDALVLAEADNAMLRVRLNGLEKNDTTGGGQVGD